MHINIFSSVSARKLKCPARLNSARNPFRSAQRGKFQLELITMTKYVQTCTRPEVFVISYLLYILTCFHFTNFFGEEKFCTLPSKNKVADENLPLWTIFFSSATLSLEGSELNFSSLKKLKNESRSNIQIWYYNYARSCAKLNTYVPR